MCFVAIRDWKKKEKKGSQVIFDVPCIKLFALSFLEETRKKIEKKTFERKKEGKKNKQASLVSKERRKWSVFKVDV